MPITHRIDRTSGIVYVDVRGSPTTAEMRGAINRVVTDPEGVPGYGILSDHRGIDTPATTNQVQALLTHLTGLKSSFGSIRWAIVVKKPASFGMMRMLAVLAEQVPAQIEVFRDVEAAKKWLTEGPAAKSD